VEMQGAQFGNCEAGTSRKEGGSGGDGTGGRAPVDPRFGHPISSCNSITPDDRDRNGVWRRGDFEQHMSRVAASTDMFRLRSADRPRTPPRCVADCMRGTLQVLYVNAPLSRTSSTSPGTGKGVK